VAHIWRLSPIAGVVWGLKRPIRCACATVLLENILTRKNERPTSLARSLYDRAYFASMSVKSPQHKQATKESIDLTIQRLAKRTSYNYRQAIARRQADESGELLVRVMRYLTPRLSRSNLADVYAALLEMDDDDLSRFARQYGWQTKTGP